jgi:hypothetical protein
MHARPACHHRAAATTTYSMGRHRLAMRKRLDPDLLALEIIITHIKGKAPRTVNVKTHAHGKKAGTARSIAGWSFDSLLLHAIGQALQVISNHSDQSRELACGAGAGAVGAGCTAWVLAWGAGSTKSEAETLVANQARL